MRAGRPHRETDAALLAGAKVADGGIRWVRDEGFALVFDPAEAEADQRSGEVQIQLASVLGHLSRWKIDGLYPSLNEAILYGALPGGNFKFHTVWLHGLAWLFEQA